MLLFIIISVILTSIAGVVDWFVCLDEDEPRMKGHHYYPLLYMEAPEHHHQIHKRATFLFVPQSF